MTDTPTTKERQATNIFPSREQKKQQNRTTILESAKQVFLESGYDATAVRDIIKRTQLAAGTFYNYFPDKQSIFRALIDRFIYSLNSELASLRERVKTLDEFVNHAYLIFFSAVASDPTAYKLVRQNQLALGQIYGRQEFGLAVAFSDADLEQAVRLGIVPNVDRAYISAAFIGLGLNIGNYMVKRAPMEPEKAARFASAMFLGGLNNISQGGDPLPK